MNNKDVHEKIMRNVMVQEIGIPADMLRMLLRYFDAASNLYVRIPMRRLMEIFTKQTCMDVPDEQLIALMDQLNELQFPHYGFWTAEELADDQLYAENPMERELLHESVIMFPEEYDELRVSQEKYAYKELPQEEFLKYEDEYYLMFTPACGEMVHFLMDTQNIDRSQAMKYMDDIMMFARHDDSGSSAISDMGRMGVQLDFVELEQFYALYRKMVRQSLVDKCCGNRPDDLPDYEEPPVPDRDEMYDEMNMAYNSYIGFKRLRMQMEGKIQLRQNRGTPSKNSLCPCGSGKKYKRCCGKGKES